MSDVACPRCGEHDDRGGWCGCCGEDLRGTPPGRYSRTAEEHAHAWVADPEARREAWRAEREGRPVPGAEPAARSSTWGPVPEAAPAPQEPLTLATMPRISEKAVAAIAFAAAGGSVVAIVLALMARGDIEASEGRLYGDGLADWALYLGVLVLVLEVLAVVAVLR